MYVKNFVKLFPSPYRVLVANSKSLSCLKFRTYSDKDEENKNSMWCTVGCSVGFALGLGYLFSDLHSRKKMLCSFDLMRFQRLLPRISASTEQKPDEQPKVNPRAMFNFLADVAEKTAPSVVYVEINARHPVTKKKLPISNGSGFIVRSDGLILTNAHVVSHYGNVTVKLYDGREFEGTIENLDTETDLATVRIKAKDLSVLPLGRSSQLRPGEFVIAMGNPLTLSHTITAGVVSSVNRQGKELGLHKKSDYIQTDAAINVGNSGGPLVNLDGEAIGINTMKVTEGISFAIPSDKAIDFLNRSENKSGSWNPFSKPQEAKKKQKYLGITMLTLTPTVIQELKERDPQFPDVDCGVMVWRVMIGSPSYECGIRPGDVITKMNDKVVASAQDIYKFLETEDILIIQILRKEKKFNVHVKLFDPVMP